MIFSPGPHDPGLIFSVMRNISVIGSGHPEWAAAERYSFFSFFHEDFGKGDLKCRTHLHRL